MYESRNEKPLPHQAFTRRILNHLASALLCIAFSLLLGMSGYAYFEQLSWLDAFLNASMILSGMGPVDLPKTEAGKLFAGLYALYSGLVFIAIAALILTPVLHRLIHKFHWEDDEP